MEKSDFIPSSEKALNSIESWDSISIASKNKRDTLKVTITTKNDLTSARETRDDKKTGELWIQIHQWKHNCNIDLQIFTAKGLKKEPSFIVPLWFESIPNTNWYVPEKLAIGETSKWQRTDLARLWCTTEIFEFSWVNFETSIQAWVFIEWTGDFWWEAIQKAIHDARGFNEVDLEQSDNTSSTLWLIAWFEAKKYVLWESLFFSTNIDGEIWFDSTWQLNFTVEIGGVVKKLKWNIWLEAWVFKLWDNIVLQNSIQNDWRYQRAWIWVEKQIGSIEIWLHFTQDQMNKDKDELWFSFSKRF